MKIKSILIFLFIVCGLTLQAQDYKVVGMESLPTDMTAREHIKIDGNGKQCAVFRIATQNITAGQREGFHFESDWGSYVVEKSIVDGEIWLWVSPGLKTLKIKHSKLGQWELHTATYGITVEALHTYKIVLQGTTVSNTNEIPEVTQQYLAFQISPTNATLFVNDELWEVGSDGSAVQFVKFGTYSYRVMAPNYHPEKGTVTVNDPENTQTVPVNLKPDFVEVTLKVDADAEIWVNNEKKSTRIWTGNLGKGTYKIECKQTGYETSMITKEITADLNGQTIDLPKPTPIYGSLNIESTPSFATIYIDGKMVGETPKFVKEMLIGQHEIRLTKDGFADHIEIITLNKDEQKQVQATLTLPTAFHNGYEYVDLGLPSGTLWATCNIGASSPEAYGSYYAWGETSTKATYNFYSWSTYKYCEGDYDKLTKYCTRSSCGNNGFKDKLTVLQSSDDVASVNWGSGWSIPTKAQWEELKNNTTVNWTTQNGVNGMKFTASNGNSIFLPAADYSLMAGSAFPGRTGYYWSSSLYTSDPNYAWYFYFHSKDYRMSHDSSRSHGFSVRPVRSERKN